MRAVLIAVAAFVVCAALAGCHIHGRMYNLATGEVTDFTFTYSGSGHGKISARFQSGEVIAGDYTTFSHPPLNWGAVYASVYGENRFGWMQQGNTGQQQYGTGVAAGDMGFVADCEYVTSSITHGSGACLAKDGIRYKVMW